MYSPADMELGVLLWPLLLQGSVRRRDEIRLDPASGQATHVIEWPLDLVRRISPNNYVSAFLSNVI